MRSVLLFILLAATTTARAQSALNARQFNSYWQVESESPHYTVTFHGDTCELLAPKGLTLWRKQQLKADCAVEYDVQVVVEDSTDRLSDMNCFWMATDPTEKNIWKRARWRNGIFARCYTLQMYYLGYGGNYNSTTRFRRYTADARGVDSVQHRPPVLVEYTDSAHLLKANHWYHIRLQTQQGRTQMWVDGRLIVSYLDPQPLSEGWFGFRTTLSRTRFANFRIEQLHEPTAADGIPLHWIGTDSCSPFTTPVVFGIPFAPGELTDASRLALSDGTPADAWVNARWPDGSVKWAAMTATVATGKQLRAVVGNKKPKAKPFVAETAQQYIVGSDGANTYIAKQGSNIIDSIVIRGCRVAGSAHLEATAGGKTYHGIITRTAIERSGNELTVIRLDGKHQGWLPFTVRLYLFNSTRQIKLVHTFVYDGDEHHDIITSLGLRFSVPMRQEPYNRQVAFATDDGGVWAEPVQPLDGRRTLTNRQSHRLQMEGRKLPPLAEMNAADKELIGHWAAWDGYRLSQLTDNSFAIRKRATTPDAPDAPATPWIGTFTGQRAPGYVYVGDTQGGLGVYMHDFWQSYPSTIQVDRTRSAEATIAMYLWSPEAEPMNLCHYDTIAHDLTASYEDVQPGLATPYGIARTTTCWIVPQIGSVNRQLVATQTRLLSANAHLLPTPQYLHSKRTFGLWSLPADTTLDTEAARAEKRLNSYLNFYRNAIEQHKWYGFWNYGDFMHAYDPERHAWRYDVGGYAWDNTELATPMWLWYSFLRTGRADVWRMAEAMTRHNAEVDTYHLGPLAPLGSRHNVSHWGCGAKEARISQAAFLRFYYYLTGGDERTGDLMHAQTDADTLLYHLDPMRLAEPREAYPCSAPARLRFGPDWLAYAGNWLAEWERTANSHYLNKIVTGLQSVSLLKNGLFTGNKAWGYDPATGRISYEGPADRQHTNHLATIMGGFEVMGELLPIISTTHPDTHSAFTTTWLDHARRYKQMARDISRNHFPVRRLMAYAAWQTRSPQLAAEAWTDLWGRIEHQQAPTFSINKVQPPLVPAPVDYWQGLTTNDAALWSLDAIYMLETIAPQQK